MKPIVIVALLSASLSPWITRSADAANGPSPARSVPVRLADLPLNRAASGVVQLVPGQPLILPFASNLGFAMTQIGGLPNNDFVQTGVGLYSRPARLDVFVGSEHRASVRFRGFGETAAYSFDPPILVPPGENLRLEFSVPIYPQYQTTFPGPPTPVQLGGDSPYFTISGWLLHPGEL